MFVFGNFINGRENDLVIVILFFFSVKCKQAVQNRLVVFGKATCIAMIRVSIFRNYPKQAGTGPSRHHIQDSKIAKELQSVEVFSSRAPGIFFERSLTMPKN